MAAKLDEASGIPPLKLEKITKSSFPDDVKKITKIFEELAARLKEKPEMTLPAKIAFVNGNTSLDGIKRLGCRIAQNALAIYEALQRNDSRVLLPLSYPQLDNINRHNVLDFLTQTGFPQIIETLITDFAIARDTAKKDVLRSDEMKKGQASYSDLKTNDIGMARAIETLTASIEKLQEVLEAPVRETTATTAAKVVKIRPAGE